MKTIRMIFAVATILAIEPALAFFDIKIKPGSTIPALEVYSNDPSKIKYNHSRSSVLEYEVEVRGQCEGANERLLNFNIIYDNQIILNIPVSDNSRSLTGNHGNEWDTYRIRIPFQDDNDKAISLCNSKAVQLLQNSSHDEVFNANFTAGTDDSGKEVHVEYSCFGALLFQDIIYARQNLPLKSKCEATGYQSRLWVTSQQLNLQPITGQDGTCKLNINGEFRTSYELYALRSKQASVPLRYRFKYQSGDHTSYSQWWNKTAHPVNGGAFIFNYTDRLPASISSGKISLQVEASGETYTGPAQSFSIACTAALPLQQTQSLDLELSVSADRSETIAVGGQLCPTHAIIKGEISAGYPISGKMILMGSSLADLHIFPIDLSAGQHLTRQKRIPINWPAAGNTLSVNAAENASLLKSRLLNYGIRVTNSNSEVVKSQPRKPFKIECTYPAVNPRLNGTGTLGMLPDHTGGGGAPTSLQAGSPFNRSGKPRKPARGGLQSDGELVQVTKPARATGHELSHIAQQRRNEPANRNYKRPTQTGVSGMGKKPLAENPQRRKPSATNRSTSVATGKRQHKPFGIMTQSNRNAAANDRFANQQNSAQRKSISNSGTFNRSSTERSQKTWLFQGKTGERCNPARFPKNAIKKQGNRQRVVECIGTKVKLNRGKQVLQRWQPGDPVFKGNVRGIQPKNDLRDNDIVDEMPDDLPPG